LAGSKVQNVEIALFGAMPHIEVRRVHMNSIFQVLTLSWSLSGGMLPGVAATDTTEATYHYSAMFFAEYGFEFSYPIFSGNKDDNNGLYLGTSLRNEFLKSTSGFQMAPMQDTYTFSSGVRWEELTIGFEHVCTHSVENFVE